MNEGDLLTITFMEGDKFRSGFLHFDLLHGLDVQGSIPSRGRDFFLFTTMSRPALGPTQSCPVGTRGSFPKR